MSFLIIQTAFIGDVILATPVLEKIHQYFPDASIDFLVRKGNESLLDNHPFLRRVLVWDKRRQKYPHLWQLLRDIRSQQYTYVVNLQRFTASGLLTAFSGAPHRIGFDKNPLWWRFTHHVPHHIASTGAADLLNIEKGFRQMTEASGAQQYVHEVDRNLSLIAHLTDNQRLRPRLYPDEKVFDRLSIVDDYYCVAPTSVWFTKQWPSGKWVELLNAFDESHKDKTIYLLGAPADRAACDQIMQASKNKQIINLAGQLNLLESAAL
ncbi:MAG: glycosyltransferase family 9 protein, partial [Bacteroidota bacterium]